MKSSTILALLILTLLSAFAVAADSKVNGCVKDKDTGKPYPNLLVEIYSADQVVPEAYDRTNDQGCYELSLPPGDYVIYLRLGKRNPQQEMTLHPDEVQTVDFIVSVKSITEETIAEDPAVWIVAMVAISIVIVIFIDQMFLRKRRMMMELEEEKKRLEQRMNEQMKSPIDPKDELKQLLVEKDKIEYMINLTKIRYHKRAMDTESFREIVRDYQKKLVELDARMSELQKT